MTTQKFDIAGLRREYTQGRLRRANLTVEPIQLFELWLRQACTAQLPDATAMSVASIDDIGQPYQRLVLLKHFDVSGMVFYTNFGSRKAKQLSHNPRISLHFPWQALARQVLVLGRVERLLLDEVMYYFYSRPRGSQISTWASRQSHPISSREVLESNFSKLEKKFQNGIVPFPSFWGGYRVIIDAMEFWQGGEHRLHDRFIYQREESGWRIDRLAP